MIGRRMIGRSMTRAIGGLVLMILAAAASVAAAGKVEGTFVVGGTDAKLRYVRAARTKLDDRGKTGFVILLSAREATGDLGPWRTGEPSKNGSFMYVILEPNGAVWIAELGHASAKTGRFGVVTEVQTSGFRVNGDQLSVTLKTNGEQTFTQDRYTIDLKVDATIDK
jgi:hypothetical protein